MYVDVLIFGMGRYSELSVCDVVLQFFLIELVRFMYLCVYCLLAYDTLQPGRWTPGLLLYIWSPSLVCKMEIQALCCCSVGASLLGYTMS